MYFQWLLLLFSFFSLLLNYYSLNYSKVIDVTKQKVNRREQTTILKEIKWEHFRYGEE